LWSFLDDSRHEDLSSGFFSGQSRYYTPALIVATPEGTYTITEVAVDGFTPSVAIVNGASAGPTAQVTVTVAAGDNRLQNVTFGNYQKVCITGSKFHDLNADGVSSDYEPGLAGVTIELLNSAGTVVDTTTTDASGAFSFTGKTPGTYSVREVVPADYFNSTPLSVRKAIAPIQIALPNLPVPIDRRSSLRSSLGTLARLSARCLATTRRFASPAASFTTSMPTA
jgi:hypothetical protein